MHSQLDAMTENDSLVINRDLLPIQTRAKVIPIDFKQTSHWAYRKEYWTIIALAKVLKEMHIYPLEAFKEAVSERSEFAEENLAAIEAGERLESN